MKYLILISALAMTACMSIQPKPVTGPDGSQDQLISCMKVEDCYNQARKICKGNYKIINTSTESLGNEGFSSTNLLIKCGD